MHFIMFMQTLATLGPFPASSVIKEIYFKITKTSGELLEKETSWEIN